MHKSLLVALTAGCALLSGCELLEFSPHSAQHVQNTTSLVDFLYPDGRLPVPETGRPQLPVPLRVGLAFLPSATGQDASLDAAHKEALLERIKKRFATRGFVSEIVLVPDYYLAGHRGFAGLEGIQRLYGVDVIALVSFDQQTHQDRNDWSLTYLSIVGQYVVKGNRHDVSTLVDLAVVDPRSRKLIIRAGGTDLRHGNTTLVDADRKTREADLTGFSAATDQMIEHFDTALLTFESDVRSGTAPVTVIPKNAARGMGGGGELDALFVGLLLLIVVRRTALAR